MTNLRFFFGTIQSRRIHNDCVSFFGEPNLKRSLSNDKVVFFYINQPDLYCNGKVPNEYIAMSEATSCRP
jgi:hypothetical protein